MIKIYIFFLIKFLYLHISTKNSKNGAVAGYPVFSISALAAA